MNDTPACPICGQPMRRYGRGATARKYGDRWACPARETDIQVDANGRLYRITDAKHDAYGPYVWTRDQLVARLAAAESEAAA